MSRCLPFPPPGYVRNGVAGEALLKQLELRRERAQSKSKRKERRKKKKWRKHEVNEDEEVMQKRCDDEDGKHEDSILSVELGQPIIPVSVYDTSDKCKLACVLGKEKSSTSSSQVMVIKTHHKVVSKCDTYLGSCLMGKSEFVANENFQTSISSFSESGKLEIESEYKKMIVNWVPPPLQVVPTDLDNEEWLSKKNRSRSERTQTKLVSIAIYRGIQPYAHYLPEADIYALPYTIPF